MSERTIATESLTKSMYHAKLSLEYLEDFQRTCRMEARRDAGLWAAKIKFVLQDVRSRITEGSRKRFDEEILTGDVIFAQSISEKWIQLTPEQREFIEKISEAFIRGEEVKIIA